MSHTTPKNFSESFRAKNKVRRPCAQSMALNIKIYRLFFYTQNGQEKDIFVSWCVVCMFVCMKLSRYVCKQCACKTSHLLQGACDKHTPATNRLQQTYACNNALQEIHNCNKGPATDTHLQQHCPRELRGLYSGTGKRYQRI